MIKLAERNMKKLLVIIALSLNLYSIAYSQSKEQKAIAAVLENQRSAWNQGDLLGYMQGYWHSDSLVFIGKRGPQYGWQKTYDNYVKSYPDKLAMGELHFTILKIEVIDKKNAFVLGTWLLNREKDEPQGYFTLRLRKINKEWKVVYDHSS